MLELEIRDITTNPAWQAKYELQVPVMAVIDATTNTERELPRASPRVNADGLEKHLLKALQLL